MGNTTVQPNKDSQVKQPSQQPGKNDKGFDDQKSASRPADSHNAEKEKSEQGATQEVDTKKAADDKISKAQ